MQCNPINFKMVRDKTSGNNKPMIKVLKYAKKVTSLYFLLSINLNLLISSVKHRDKNGDEIT